MNRSAKLSPDSAPLALVQDSHPSVTVVICCYTSDRWDVLLQAVDSAVRQTYAADQVMVVVDHNENLHSRLKAALSSTPMVQVIANEQHPGLSGARNTGLDHSEGDIVAFLDDDAVADSEWLRLLTSAYASPAVLGVGGAALPEWVGGRRPPMLAPEFDWVIGCSYRGLPTTQSRVRNMIGANMSARRDVFERAGGFRIDLGRVRGKPLGCEETEFCIRAERLHPGGSFIYEPLATVRHLVTPDRQTWRYLISRCYSEGLSKAAVVGLVGPKAGLTSERSYSMKTLPAGILRGILRALRERKPDGLVQAMSILIGFVVTAMGYIRGRLGSR
jgi:glycosyltransferase involved in cell wall biosynthesis